MAPSAHWCKPVHVIDTSARRASVPVSCTQIGMADEAYHRRTSITEQRTGVAGGTAADIARGRIESTAAGTPGRNELRVERTLPPADRVAEVVDKVGVEVGRAVGYLQSRSPSDMRADAEALLTQRPLVSIAAALGLGYIVGWELRR